ncbi:sigma 54-interacting transcriptional regulator, partial [bacterium]|nr:sigma 54-interacting transcriptional regulator [bacterium]MBU1025628.1 sigma 54-interacting transcriptional regulator [bacterium]
MFSILIVDKELRISESLRIQLNNSDVQLLHVESVENCFHQIGLKSFDLILLEIPSSDDDCLENLDKIKKASPGTEIIMLAHDGQMKQAIASLKAGANDVYVKPLDFNSLLKKLDKMRSEDRITSSMIGKPGEEPGTFSQLSSRNFHFQKTLDELEDIARTDASILLIGERGTGKRTLARVIHNTSNLRNSGFVEIDCRKISATEFELAGGGTLFLNEVSNLDLDMQSKLLDAIDQNNASNAENSNEFSRNKRIIAASNVNLESRIKDRKFRQDLYFRLKTAMFEIPPLRERPEDIINLFLGFMPEFNVKLKRSVSGIAPDVGEFLENYYWQGNIPELRNLCESIMVKIKGDTVDRRHLPDELKIRKLEAFKSLQEIQREHILTTLD